MVPNTFSNRLQFQSCLIGLKHFPKIYSKRWRSRSPSCHFGEAAVKISNGNPQQQQPGAHHSAESATPINKCDLPFLPVPPSYSLHLPSIFPTAPQKMPRSCKPHISGYSGPLKTWDIPWDILPSPFHHPSIILPLLRDILPLSLAQLCKAKALCIILAADPLRHSSAGVVLTWDINPWVWYNPCYNQCVNQ